jgi:hypothetical protein
MSNGTKPPAEDQVAADRVRERAYYMWEKAGRPEGRDLDHWLAAQTEEFPVTGEAAPKRTTTRSTKKKTAATKAEGDTPSGKKKSATKRSKKAPKKT